MAPRALAEYGSLLFADSVTQRLDMDGAGFSAGGDMVGSDAVIGWIDRGQPTVSLYMLSGQLPAGDTNQQRVTVSGGVSNHSITYEDGLVTMRFTRPMAAVNGHRFALTPDSASFFLWAVGIDDQLSLHYDRGSYSLSLSSGDASVAGTAKARLPRMPVASCHVWLRACTAVAHGNLITKLRCHTSWCILLHVLRMLLYAA